MSSLYSYENVDINDIKNYSIFQEEGIDDNNETNLKDVIHPFAMNYPCKLNIDSREYLSVAHYYHAQKFKDSSTKIYKQILAAQTQLQANLLAIKNNDSMDPNFIKVRKKIYYKGQKYKFQQHNDLKQILLETKQKPIICISNDTFFGLLKSKNNEKLNGDNIAGIILATIRDEMLLNDSDCDDDYEYEYDDLDVNNDEKKDNEDDAKNDKNDDENKLIKGDTKKKFNMTYSAIFAPFVVSVVVRLLNNSNQGIRLNLDKYINDWGGGIAVIRKCCNDHQIDPNDKNCNWDTLIDLCCIATPLTHHSWLRLMRYNKLKVTNDPVINLKNLLNKWEKKGAYNRMYGTYPTAKEQEFYIQETIPRNISEILNYAIITDVFKDAFIAMDKCKRPEPTVSQQATSFMGGMWDLVHRTIADMIPMQ